jgi:hypothetical protein
MDKTINFTAEITFNHAAEDLDASLNFTEEEVNTLYDKVMRLCEEEQERSNEVSVAFGNGLKNGTLSAKELGLIGMYGFIQAFRFAQNACRARQRQ